MLDVFMYNGVAAGFFCSTEGFFAGVGGTLLLVEVEIRLVAALLSLGIGDSSKVVDLCRLRSRALVAASFAVVVEVGR